MDIDSILIDFYGLRTFELVKLEGYESTNYKVDCGEAIFVLKVYAFAEETAALLRAENAILNELTTLKAYDFPEVVATDTNEELLVVKGHIYRLLSYVEGAFLGDVSHPPALLFSFGEFLAQMDKTIFETYNPAIAGKETQWDLQHFKSNRKFIGYIPDAKDRNLVDYFFLQFDEHVYPIQHRLRKGIIHNDGNDWNVLTQNDRVSGIIDFGDMCHSWLINEIAIAITYVMMGKENPLEVAMQVMKGYHTIVPLKEHELDILYYLVAARLCTSVCNSAYTKTLKPDSAYITISERPAWDLLYKWLSINPIKATDTFREAAAYPPTPKITIEQQTKRRSNHLSKALSLSYKKPIQMHRSAFQYMYDAEGNTFLDAYNNIMLSGHCHPRVVRAGQRAMAKLNTNTRYVYEELLAYSEVLLLKFPSKLNKVFLVNSGSAASDLAIRIAMQYTRKEKVMVLEHGYHGNTRMGIDISAYKYNHQGGPGRQEHIIETPMPKAFGSGFADEEAAGRHFANHTIDQIHSNKNHIAAFIAEPIVGCGGQVPLAKGYLKEVYPKIREQGGVCISDEVQVGFGRLGDYFWGYEMHGVAPDMVIIGKPMGNGHPIGAVVTTSEIAESFDNGPEFFSSFGGNPVSCEIGRAVLEVIEEEGLQHHAKKVGDHLMSLLKNLQKKYPQIADVRGSGLFLGVEITDIDGHPNTQLASDIKNGLRDNHMLISTDGPDDNVLKIKPPLSFNTTNAEQLAIAIDMALGRFINI